MYCKTTDGGYIIAGEREGDVYLVKTDKKGKKLWSKRYGGKHQDYGEFVRQTRDGGYIIVGETKTDMINRHYIYLIKTDPKGNVK